MIEVKNIKEIKNSSFLQVPNKVLGVEKRLIKMFLVPVAVLVGFLVSLGLVVLPKIGEINVNFEQMDNLKNQIKLNNQKKGYLMSIDQEQLIKDSSFMNQAILKEKKSYLLVGIIRNIADKFGFQIKSFSVNPGTVKETVDQSIKVSDKSLAKRMPISMTLIGPSDKNLELIKSLENSLPILFIDKFKSNTSILGVSELDLVISSYYLPEKNDYTSGNLTLDDLRLTPEESDLLMTISSFESNSSSLSESDLEAEFVKYERKDPFNL